MADQLTLVSQPSVGGTLANGRRFDPLTITYDTASMDEIHRSLRELQSVIAEDLRPRIQDIEQRLRQLDFTNLTIKTREGDCLVVDVLNKLKDLQKQKEQSALQHQITSRVKSQELSRLYTEIDNYSAYFRRLQDKRIAGNSLDSLLNQLGPLPHQSNWSHTQHSTSPVVGSSGQNMAQNRSDAFASSTNVSSGQIGRNEYQATQRHYSENLLRDVARALEPLLLGEGNLRDVLGQRLARQLLDCSVHEQSLRPEMQSPRANITGTVMGRFTNQQARTIFYLQFFTRKLLQQLGRLKQYSDIQLRIDQSMLEMVEREFKGILTVEELLQLYSPIPPNRENVRNEAEHRLPRPQIAKDQLIFQRQVPQQVIDRVEIIRDRSVPINNVVVEHTDVLVEVPVELEKPIISEVEKVVYVPTESQVMVLKEVETQRIPEPEIQEVEKVVQVAVPAYRNSVEVVKVTEQVPIIVYKELACNRPHADDPEYQPPTDNLPRRTTVIQEVPVKVETIKEVEVRVQVPCMKEVPKQIEKNVYIKGNVEEAIKEVEVVRQVERLNPDEGNISNKPTYLYKEVPIIKEIPKPYIKFQNAIHTCNIHTPIIQQEPVEVVRQKIVEKIVEKVVYRDRPPVTIYQDKIVEVEKIVEKIVVQKVGVPVHHYIDREVEVMVIVENIVERPIIQEKLIEVEKIKYLEKTEIVRVPEVIVVQINTQVPVEVVRDRIVTQEKLVVKKQIITEVQEVPVQVPYRVEIPKEIQKEKIVEKIEERIVYKEGASTTIKQYVDRQVQRYVRVPQIILQQYPVEINKEKVVKQIEERIVQAQVFVDRIHKVGPNRVTEIRHVPVVTQKLVEVKVPVYYRHEVPVEVIREKLVVLRNVVEVFRGMQRQGSRHQQPEQQHALEERSENESVSNGQGEQIGGIGEIDFAARQIQHKSTQTDVEDASSILETVKELTTQLNSFMGQEEAQQSKKMQPHLLDLLTELSRKDSHLCEVIFDKLVQNICRIYGSAYSQAQQIRQRDVTISKQDDTIRTNEETIRNLKLRLSQPLTNPFVPGREVPREMPRERPVERTTTRNSSQDLPGRNPRRAGTTADLNPENGTLSDIKRLGNEHTRTQKGIARLMSQCFTKVLELPSPRHYNPQDFRLVRMNTSSMRIQIQDGQPLRAQYLQQGCSEKDQPTQASMIYNLGKIWETQQNAAGNSMVYLDPQNGQNYWDLIHRMLSRPQQTNLKEIIAEIDKRSTRRQ